MGLNMFTLLLRLRPCSGHLQQLSDRPRSAESLTGKHEGLMLTCATRHMSSTMHNGHRDRDQSSVGDCVSSVSMLSFSHTTPTTLTTPRFAIRSCLMSCLTHTQDVQTAPPLQETFVRETFLRQCSPKTLRCRHYNLTSLGFEALRLMYVRNFAGRQKPAFAGGLQWSDRCLLYT